VDRNQEGGGRDYLQEVLARGSYAK
jgi:hypothetical protein